MRKMFVMQLKPDCEAEYTKRHDDLWPELEETLKSHGVHNYSISLDQNTNQLFAYAEIESEARWNAIGETEVCRKWWSYMSEIMETNEDSIPKSFELKELFYLK